MKLKQRGEAGLGECQQRLVEEIRKVDGRQLSRKEPAPREFHRVVTTQRREGHAPAERKHALSREDWMIMSKTCFQQCQMPFLSLWMVPTGLLTKETVETEWTCLENGHSHLCLGLIEPSRFSVVILMN